MPVTLAGSDDLAIRRAHQVVAIPKHFFEGTALFVGARIRRDAYNRAHCQWRESEPGVSIRQIFNQRLANRMVGRVLTKGVDQDVDRTFFIARVYQI